MLDWFKRTPVPDDEDTDFIEPDVAANLLPPGAVVEGVIAEDWLQARVIWRALGFRNDRFNCVPKIAAYIATFRQKREGERA